MNTLLQPEEYLYCARSRMNLAVIYEESRVYSRQGYLRIDLIETWSAGECELSIVFDEGVVAFIRTDEIHALARPTAIDFFRGRNDCKPWPLFEIKNSERLRLFGFNNDLVLQGLRHFFVLTDSRFTDVFSYHPPRMIVKNRFDCDGKEHRDGFCKSEQDNIQIMVP